MALEALAEVIDQLVEAEPSSLADKESLVELFRQLSRLDSVVTRATGAFDSAGEWALDGAQTAAAWLATLCHLPGSSARRRVSQARSLRLLPACAEAWSQGEISAPHVDAIASVRTETSAPSLERDEDLLVDQAKSMRFEKFSRVLAYWEQHADPDGTEEAAEARRARRDVFLSSSFGGTWLGKMTLDPVGGAIVFDELTRLEKELFEADWAGAKADLGREPTISELARTPAQRRADALVEMATRSKTAPVDGKRPAPLFSVLVGYETLHGRICELTQGAALTPGSLIPWLDQALVERVVFAPNCRVEVSATARLFSGATRRAIEVRDGGCTHDFCDRPAGSCQADHIVPYSQGGPTTQENGQMLCGFHNRLRNKPPPQLE